MIASETLPENSAGSQDTWIARQRVVNQHIIDSQNLDRPHDVVKAMGFIQAQDYLGSLWAVGLRMGNARESMIEQALAERTIVRTWPSRNTLGYVAAKDLYWILDLLTPRAMAARQGRYRQLGLTHEDFTTSSGLLAAALKKKGQLTRVQSNQVLEEGGVSTEGQRGIHILSHLAIEKLICFGPRDGKQQTFVLLEDWLPELRSKPREEALSELVLRFFSSHGPATAKDFAWWSGLALADVKAGLANVKSRLVEEHINGKTYWMPSSSGDLENLHGSTVLLPGFDEYLVGYTDRSAVLDPELARHVNANGGMLNPVIVIDGVVKGTWKRTLKKDTVEVETRWFEDPDEGERVNLESAAQRYADFLGVNAQVREAAGENHI